MQDKMEEVEKEFSSAWEKLVDQMGQWFTDLVLMLPQILLSIILAVITYYSARYIRKYCNRIFGRFFKNRSTSRAVSSIVTVVFSVVMLFVILGILDLDEVLTRLLATAGVLGLAIGLALQEPLNNIFSGIMLSVRERYNLEDWVETNGYFGVVKDINLKTTILHRPSGEVVSLPNKEVLQNPIINYSYRGARRVDLSCGVSYGEDLQVVEDTAIEAIKKSGIAVENRDIELFFNSFGDSSVNFVLRFWIEQVDQKSFLKAQSEGIKVLKGIFDEKDILIPFPIRTLDFAIKGGDKLKSQLVHSNNNNQ